MRLLKSIVALSTALVALHANASHIPPGSTPLNYLGTFNSGATVSGQLNQNGQDGYDWYCVAVTSGTAVQFTATSPAGQLLPNIGLLSTVGVFGAPYSTINATFLADAANSSASTDTLNFTPASTGNYTVYVSTWTGQIGTYSLTGTGFSAVPGGCGAPPVVIPPPTVGVATASNEALAALSLILAIAGLGFVRHRGLTSTK